MGEPKESSGTEACVESDSKKEILEDGKNTIASLDDKDSVKKKKITIDEAEEEPKINRWLSKGIVSWRLVKAAIFVACATFFAQQAAEFYALYHTYPTTISMRVTKPKEIQKPAITVCDTNIIPRSRFCADYEDSCQLPDSLPEFCLKHSHFCTGNISHLRIPQLGYYADTSEVFWKLEELHNENKLNEFSFHYLFGGYTKETVVFDWPEFFDRGHCMSDNLHLDDAEEAETVTSTVEEDFFDPLRGPGIEVYRGVFSMERSEVFLPWDEPRLLLSIHSPFIRSNPMKESNSYSLEPGYEYIIDVSLEEQHLLPHPYPTDCRDYEAEWEKNNRNGPRSEETCVELCRRSFVECYFKGSVTAGTHYLSQEEFLNMPQDYVLCPFEPSEFMNCSKYCKTNCIKREYTYTVNKRRSAMSVLASVDRDEITVYVNYKSPEVVVMSYNPLYGDGELFSYIGGLMGCWLGMSVWAFTGTLETTIRRIFLMMQAFRRLRQTPSAEDAA